MLKSFLFMFVFVGSTFLTYSQTNNWDLQKCIEYAQKNNLSLKQSEITAEINKNTYQQSQAGVLPSLNGNAQHNYNFGRTIDRYTNTFANTQVLSQNFFLSSNVVLWSGLSQYNSIKANQYRYLSSKETYLQQQNDLALNVATAFINVIFSKEILQISQAQYNISKDQLERTQKLIDAGTAAKSALYDVKAQLANDAVTLTNSDNNYQIAILSLKQLLNLDSLNNFNISAPDLEVISTDLTTMSVQNIYETALKNQHSIKSANYNMIYAEKNLDAARGRVSPSISASGSFGSGTSGLAKNIDAVNVIGIEQTPYVTSSGEYIYQPKTEVITSPKNFSDQFKDNVNKTLGFSLTVPIFNGLQTYTGIKNAKLNAISAKYSTDLAEQNLYKTIAQAYANAKAALDKYNANKASVEASELSFNSAQQKYDVGAITNFDYNTAKIRLQNAQGNLVQAKYDYIFKLKVLDYYQGKELKF